MTRPDALKTAKSYGYCVGIWNDRDKGLLVFTDCGLIRAFDQLDIEVFRLSEVGESAYTELVTIPYLSRRCTSHMIIHSTWTGNTIRIHLVGFMVISMQQQLLLCPVIRVHLEIDESLGIIQETARLITTHTEDIQDVCFHVQQMRR